jgi:hypothetical protein
MQLPPCHMHCNACEAVVTIVTTAQSIILSRTESGIRVAPFGMKLNSTSPHSLENACVLRIERMRKALFIEGVKTAVGVHRASTCPHPTSNRRYIKYVSVYVSCRMYNTPRFLCCFRLADLLFRLSL